MNAYQSYLKSRATARFQVFCIFVVVCILPVCLVVGCGRGNCGSKTCSVHGHLNQPKPATIDYRYEVGDFVEHVFHGTAVISSRRKSIKNNWPAYNIRFDGGRHDVWEHELKPLKIEGYPSPNSEQKSGLAKDLELQMMEERIEKRLIEKLGQDEVTK